MDSQPRVKFGGFSAFYSVEEQTMVSWVVTAQNGDIEIDRAKLRSAVSDWPAKQRKGRGDDKILPPPAGNLTLLKHSVALTKP